VSTRKCSKCGQRDYCYECSQCNSDLQARGRVAPGATKVYRWRLDLAYGAQLDRMGEEIDISRISICPDDIYRNAIRRHAIAIGAYDDKDEPERLGGPDVHVSRPASPFELDETKCARCGGLRWVCDSGLPRLKAHGDDGCHQPSCQEGRRPCPVCVGCEPAEPSPIERLRASQRDAAMDEWSKASRAQRSAEEALTRVQIRCGELLEETRHARAELADMTQERDHWRAKTLGWGRKR